MTPRKRLEGALAEWHPHPKNANNSLVPVVRNAAPADDIADRFFDSAPQGYMPELPPAVEVADVGKASTRRAALHSAAARERRRYLTRYVAGAVGLAAVIGLGALVRVSVTRDASAAQAPTRPASFNAASEALAEPLSPAPAQLTAPSLAEPEPASPMPADTATTAPGTAADSEHASERSPSNPTPTDLQALARETESAASPAQPEATAQAAATDTDAKAASEAKRESQRALDRGHLRKAIEAGERSVKFDPTDADAWLILGAAYQGRGAYTEARRCFSSCSHQAKRGARSECRALLR